MRRVPLRHPIGHITCAFEGPYLPHGQDAFRRPDQLHCLEERLTTTLSGRFRLDAGLAAQQDRMTGVSQHDLGAATGIAEITNQLEFDDEGRVSRNSGRSTIMRAMMETSRFAHVSFTHPHDPYAGRPRFWTYWDDEIDAGRTPPASTGSILTVSRMHG